MASFDQGYALIVGVGADLPNTIDDAVGLADILKDPARCAYPPDQVQVLHGDGARRKDILAAFHTLSQSTNVQSTVIVYFSGHGYRVTSPTGEFYYLLPYGHDLERLFQTAISGTEFTDRLRAIPAQKLVVLLDCCHAGGIGEAKAPGLQMTKSPLPPEAQGLLAEGSGRVLIASSREDELSFAGRPYSAFTLALIEALSGVGVAKQDGYTRVTDLALHAREVVPERTGGRQHPILQFEQADNFVLAYYAGGETQPKGVPFAEAPEIEPEPGAWTITVDQRGQIVHGHQVVITGGVSGQIALGEGITQIQTIGAAQPGEAKIDLSELRRLLDDLKAKVTAKAPSGKREAALERVQELEEAITAKEPRLATMEYVEDWFSRHLPELADDVTRVIAHPSVVQLVEAAGDTLAAEFQRRFNRRRGAR